MIYELMGNSVWTDEWIYRWTKMDGLKWIARWNNGL